MRLYAMLPTVLATSAMMSALSAQEPRIVRVGPGSTVLSPGSLAFETIQGDGPRAVIGVSTSSSASARDTLGVLVSAVRTDSPAEKAGIQEGDRIASINGVNFRLTAVDIGDDGMAGVLSRRLGRELDKLKPGDDVELRVYAGGQTKTLKVKTMSPSDLYQTRTPRRAEDRATLGINLAVTGSSRDTLGVFVFSVDDSGPAAKAGIEEGARIASINGVDVRGRQRVEEDENLIRASNVSRLEREVSRLKPGDDVDLRVYANGQSRDVKFKAGRASDLHRRNRPLTIMGGDNLVIPDLVTRIDAPRIGAEVRRAIETSVQGMGRAFGRIGGRMNW